VSFMTTIIDDKIAQNNAKKSFVEIAAFPHPRPP